MSEYINFYSKWMDSRIDSNYKTAGGDLYPWEETGKRQLEFLKSQGFKTDIAEMVDKFYNILELGFGTFPFGFALFKEYEKYGTYSGRYKGFDISDKSYRTAKKICYYNDLQIPDLYINKDFLFHEFDNSPHILEFGFDYIWAFSVFNHLPINHFEEFLNNVRKIINKDSIILLTIWTDKGETRPAEINTSVNRSTSFFYNMQDVKQLCDTYGFNVEIVDTKPYIVFYSFGSMVMLKITRR